MVGGGGDGGGGGGDGVYICFSFVVVIPSSEPLPSPETYPRKYPIGVYDIGDQGTTYNPPPGVLRLANLHLHPRVLYPEKGWNTDSPRSFRVQSTTELVFRQLIPPSTLILPRGVGSKST